MNQDLKIKLASPDYTSNIRDVLLDWLTPEEAEYYIVKINDQNKLYDSHYYLALLNDKVVGIIAYREPAPKVVRFTISEKPAEINMLYVGKEYCRGQGIGKTLLSYITDEVKGSGYTELVVRSAEKFKDTGWGFYDHMNFSRAGELMPPESETRSKVWNKVI